MTGCRACGAPLPPNKGPGRQRIWCSEKCRKTQYSTPCESCGAPTDGSAGHGPNAPKVCSICNTAHMVDYRRRQLAEHRALTERLWSEGKTLREVCALIGVKYHHAYLAQWRSRGYNLPYRRTPEQVARITASSAEHFAHARAVMAERRAAA